MRPPIAWQEASLAGAARLAGRLAERPASENACENVCEAAREAAATSPYVVDACFKYATAARCFAPIATRSVGLTTDAVTIRARHA